MPVASSGTISFNSIITEMGLSGSQGISGLYTRMFGVPSTSQTDLPATRFYGAYNPNKKVHLDANTLSLTTGTQVSTWTGTDSMPNATGMSATGGSVPTFQNSGGTTGKYVNLNSSSSQHFTLPSITMTFRDASNNPINGFSCFLVVRRSTTVGDWERYIDFGNGAAANNILVARPSTSTNITVVEIFNNSDYMLSQKGATTDGSWQVVCFVILNGTTSSITMYVNGTSTTVSGQNTTTLGAFNNRTTTSNYIGRSNWGDAYLNADFKEIILLNNALTANQVSYWTTYLRNKWGI